MMGVVVYIICMGGLWHTSGATLDKIMLLLGAVLAGIFVYGGASYLLGSEEIHSTLQIIKKKTASYTSRRTS